jgi:hypothetical protein
MKEHKIQILEILEKELERTKGLPDSKDHKKERIERLGRLIDFQRKEIENV